MENKEEKKEKKERVPRHGMPEQDPKVRVKNFQEVPTGYTEETAIAEAKRAGVFISGYDVANLPLPSNEELRRRGLYVLPQTDSNDDE